MWMQTPEYLRPHTSVFWLNLVNHMSIVHFQEAPEGVSISLTIKL